MLNEKLMAEAAATEVTAFTDEALEAAAATMESTEASNDLKMVEKLIKDGVLERDSIGRIKRVDPNKGKTVWVEERSVNPIPHHTEVTSGLYKVERGESDGHIYDIFMPTYWSMASVIVMRERTDKIVVKDNNAKFAQNVTMHEYVLHVGEAIDVIRNKVDHDLPREVVAILKIIIKRNWKKITF